MSFVQSYHHKRVETDGSLIEQQAGTEVDSCCHLAGLCTESGSLCERLQSPLLPEYLGAM